MDRSELAKKPLQRLCLNVIVNNFTIYSSADMTATDPVLQKGLLFLRIKCTSIIMDELWRKEYLRKEHLDFLINEYLKEVDPKKLLKLLDKSEVIEKVSKIGNSLVRLEVSHLTSHVDKEDCLDALKAIVPFCSKMTEIAIFKTCDDDLLELMANSCPLLSTLEVDYAKHITSRGISAFCLNPNKCPLKVVNFSHSSLTWDDIGNLLKCIPTLQEVEGFPIPQILYYIHKEDIKKGDLDKISKYNLTNIEFSRIYTDSQIEYNNVISACCCLCPAVKKIEISQPKAHELRLYTQFLKLEDMTIRSKVESGIDLNDFLSVKRINLKKLYVYSCHLSMTTLMSCCSNLEKLLLDTIQFQNLDDTASKPMPFLKCLYFRNYSDNYFVKSLVALLNNSLNLEIISFQYVRVEFSEIVEQLVRFPLRCSIRKLEFYDCKHITIDDLKRIVLSCSMLDTISIGRCDEIKFYHHFVLKQIATSSKKSIDFQFR